MAMRGKSEANTTETLRSIILGHYEWILIILSPFILFGPMLLSGNVLFWGTPIMQFVPWREFAIDSLLSGHLPLWNPWLGMGAPLIANYQSAIFYPPNWILLLTDPAWGHGLLVLLHVLWTGIGMLLLAKQLGLSKLSQAVAALSFSLSGYIIARAGFLSINATAAWLPWIILAADRLIQDQGPSGNMKRLAKPTIFLSLMLCLQWLAGHAQTSWYCLIFTAIWVIWRGYSSRRWIGLVQGGIALGVAAFVAFLLSAVQLLPTAEYLFHSDRALEVERELAMAYSFWPWRVLGLVMPNLFGHPATGDYWGYATYWEDAIYIGTLPFILSLFACLRGFKGMKYSSLVRLLFIVIPVSFLLALGKNTPVFPFLYEHVPAFNLFQAPTRWTILMVFSLSILAGFGAELWQRRELLSLFWVRLGTAGAAAAAIFALLGGRVLSDLKPTFTPAIAAAGIWLMLSGVIAWRRRIRPSPYWPALIAVFIAIDLLWAVKGLNPSISIGVFQGDSKFVETVSPNHRVYMPKEIEDTIKYKWTHRFDTFFPDVDWKFIRDIGLPNTTILDGIPTTNNFDPILPERYATWMEEIEKASSEKLTELLEMMDVGWMANFGTDQEYEISYSDLPNPSRTHLVGEAIWVTSGQDAMKAVLDSDFSHREQVVLEGKPIHAEITDPVDSEVSIVDQSDPNKVEIKVSAGSACWLVLADTWFPGWQVRIDGESAELYRANYLFKAVHLSIGKHIVEFIYRPISFILGGGISLMSWSMVGAFLWILKRR